MDIRTPISLLFAILGVMIAVCGLILPQEVYHKSLDININLIWGLVLVGFSGLMLLWIWADKVKENLKRTEDQTLMALASKTSTSSKNALQDSA